MKISTKAIKILLLIVAVILVLFCCMTVISAIGCDYILHYIEDNIEAVDYTTQYEKATATTNAKVYSNGDSAKILHITDTHIVASILTTALDRLAVNAIADLVHTNQPDLVVITGDIVYPQLILGNLNSKISITAFGTLMNKLNVPFAVTLGNHDAEGNWDGKTQGDYYSSIDNSLFSNGPDDVDGVGNYVVEVYTPQDNQYQFSCGLIMLDSHRYVEGTIRIYDYVHDNQVDWYQQQIDNLKSAYGNDAKSIVYVHIPPYEQKLASQLYLAADPSVELITGTYKKSPASSKRTDGKLFDKVVELQSTKAIFVGHDHVNNHIITYRGVTMGYGMSIDYVAFPFIALTKQYRGGTLVKISDNISVALAPQLNNWQPLSWHTIA